MWSLEKSAESVWLQDEFSRRKIDSNAAKCKRSRQIMSEAHHDDAAIKKKSSPPLMFHIRTIQQLIATIANQMIIIIIVMLITLSQISPPSSFVAEADPLTQASKSTHKQPHFVEPESGEVQRVSEGRSVKFKCVVNDIGNHKVIWFHKEKRLPLVIDNQVNFWKDRLHASSQGNSVFFLQLDNVQVSDKVSWTRTKIHRRDHTKTSELAKVMIMMAAAVATV